MKPAVRFLLFFAPALFIAGGVFAAAPCPQPAICSTAVCITNPLTACTLTDLIDGIINFIFTIALAITPIMVIVGGFMFITGGGDPAKITQGKQLLLWTAIGLTVILLAKGLVAVLRNVLGI
ncbi:MAG: hypothetical protein UY24_C0001G0032 [Parcubacteria group bacterium GW2011_GWA1_48_11b]|uniref:TrbC/VIRB2 family protein n=1 Tax=Candidatus Adlerbacteria bacterium GW2011_GWC1_50_9 TaxID=1618608 RepID=A0A0G1WK33_9BACT|nr:MAG: hypothetical protein UY24_C0001G0032 [Parcubacteria group bacterium GW2011_GWA1_48_11b]KKW19106.1 MAG: hypothetical protein UY61_C0065G0006 [Candidatus Adlerbacteria bacterium GW2011_GWC1_50_9]